MLNYKIKLISHACVFIDLGEIKLITDPWLFGDCFNNGWSLKRNNLKVENITDNELNSITHLWISHEHPDHFHIQSLKFIISKIKNISKIKVICKNDTRTSEDILKVLKVLGFKTFKTLNHLEKYDLNKKISIRIYHHRHLDSALLVFDKNKPLIINLNDCEILPNECQYIRKRFGSFPLVLNQFSIAGFEGIYSERKLSLAKNTILQNMVNQHISLGAKTTIPFASFCWFSSKDNQFLNKWHNTLEDVWKHFNKKRLNIYCLEPPSELIKFEEIVSYKKAPQIKIIPIDSEAKYETIDTEKIISTIKKRLKELKTSSNSMLFQLFEKNIIFFIKDISCLIDVNFRNIEVKILDKNTINELKYMEINSQPLYFAFANTFGIQTLGVSGRFKFINYEKVPNIWKLIRILSSLDNNKTPLRLSSLLSFRLYKELFNRRVVIFSQIFQQLKRFKNN